MLNDTTGQHKEQPAENAFAITPSDNELEVLPRGIYVGGTGDLICIMRNGRTITFTEIAAGMTHPIRPQKILQTTTATGLVGIY